MKFRAILSGVEPNKTENKTDGIPQIFSSSLKGVEDWAKGMLRGRGANASVLVYQTTEVLLRVIKPEDLKESSSS